MGITKKDIIEFLKELGIDETQENIKWAFEVMLKQLKLELKFREFEIDNSEFLDKFTADNCCSDEGCCCTEKKK